MCVDFVLKPVADVVVHFHMVQWHFGGTVYMKM